MRERFEGRGGLRVKGEVKEGEGEGEVGEVHLRKYSDLVCYINQISTQ